MKIGKKNDGCRRFAEIDEPRIARDAHDFEILVVRHDAVANGLSNGIAIREEAFRKSAAHDNDMRVILVIGFSKFASSEQRNTES